jgi:hypothetical protein
MKDYRAEFPLEFCALRFLLQWLGSEQSLYRAIASSPTDEDIRKALAYFQVSRNFKGLSKEPAKVTLIRDALLNTRSNRILSADMKVEELARALQLRFEQFNLSAASKLLWLSFREPYVIYDKRAVEALSQKFKHKFSHRSYSQYAGAWRSQYADLESAIGTAVKELPKGRMFMPACRLTDEELLRLAGEAWFKERVFDIFLWEVGGDG